MDIYKYLNPGFSKRKWEFYSLVTFPFDLPALSPRKGEESFIDFAAAFAEIRRSFNQATIFLSLTRQAVALGITQTL